MKIMKQKGEPKEKLIKSADDTSIFDNNLVGSEQYQLLLGVVTKLREMCAKQK